MSLGDVWFGIFVAIIAGYLILDGFDFGVGIVHLIAGRSDEDRRLLLNSIGPVWDGNEVWIVLGGGVLFAAFPLVYASLFSGFYVAFALVLLVMILRTVAIEFRSKRQQASWRYTWDAFFSLASAAIAFLLGVAFGNILEGVKLDSQGDINDSLVDLLNPYALLIGLTALAMFAMHGLAFLTLKAEGDLEVRVRGLIRKAIVAFFVLTNIAVIATALFEDTISDSFTSDVWPLVFPAGALVAFVICWRAVATGRDYRAFAASAAMIALLLMSGAAGMYPNLLISSDSTEFNLTVTNAASADNTLRVMLVVAVIGMPLILLYTAGIYYFFRGKTRLAPDSY
ncbi:MAG TPA: cytochrome d ubiquinol oxidase subunit II [Dehalococcoidia bacterium]